MFNNKKLLVTGGTGSFGKKFIATLFDHASYLKPAPNTSEDDDKNLMFMLVLTVKVVFRCVELCLIDVGIYLLNHCLPNSQTWCSISSSLTSSRSGIIGMLSSSESSAFPKPPASAVLSTKKPAYLKNARVASEAMAAMNRYHREF